MNTLLIREITENDAHSFLDLCKQLDRETKFMLLEPDERLTTSSEQKEQIKEILSADNQTIFIAESAGRLVGYLEVSGEKYRRNRHSAHVVIGILQTFTGQELATSLFSELETWVHVHDVHRLELTVMCHNEKAVRLYQKVGFEIEGTKRRSLCVNGTYIDEYYMAKLIL